MYECFLVDCFIFFHVMMGFTSQPSRNQVWVGNDVEIQ
jgi:hypothetical protein